MKAKWIIIALLILLLLLCGCQTHDLPDTDTTDGQDTETAVSGLPHNEDQYHVGGTISDAYVDPSLYTVDEDDLRAVGFEYDYDSLTYELVWSDEFSYEGAPDSEKWGYDVGGTGWGNHELQYYTAGENVQVADGLLTIALRKEEVGGMDYTSTRLVSRQRGDWLYCKVEVSAKLPSGLGTWPAIWMLPTDWHYGDWPASGEVDIMEHVGYDQDVIVQSIHCNQYYAGNSKSSSRTVNGVSEDFHTYAVEWLPDRIIFSVDGNVTWSYEPSKLTSQPTADYWPFDQRMHLLINLAFGGDWGGAHGIDDSILPVEYQIDYVRVYQSPEIMALTGQN